MAHGEGPKLAKGHLLAQSPQFLGVGISQTEGGQTCVQRLPRESWTQG